MTRVIPGVEINVVKEVVPPQLAPSGVLGLVGLTETALTRTERASSWNRFLEVAGPASAYSLPEARLALGNGVFELVLVPLKSSVAKRATEAKLKLEARAPGVWANGYKLRVSDRNGKFDLEVRLPQAGDKDAPLEVIRDLDDAGLANKLAQGSAVLRPQQGAKLAAGEYTLGGGADASAQEYINALEALKDESDVDLVVAAMQDLSNADQLAAVYSGVISHCQVMSRDSKGRIGFGQVPPGATLDAARTLATKLLSDRFVLLAPYGVVGAAAGRVGSLDYFQSPTFKALTGVSSLSRAIPLEEQGQLLQASVVPVVEQRGRGVIVLRGLTTDGDQISVRRVADRAVRGVRLIGELFIGRLNNEDGRGALKQKLAEFLAQMQKEGALVPSTDGKDPAFQVDVYSSQADFALGVVRVAIAVRPVRAIDFIYATILVQV
jgi:hypothetical protein